MNSVLAVDMGSGGVTAAHVDSSLKCIRSVERVWTLEPDSEGSATLSATDALDAASAAISECAGGAPPPTALVLSSMMHTLVVDDSAGVPRTPVFTWMDTAALTDEARMRERLGSAYTRRTGAWFHPSFPAYKIVRLRRRAPDVFASGHRIRSLPGYIQNIWTGADTEDVSAASAAGLLDLETGLWDDATIEALEIEPNALPPISEAGSLVGHLGNTVARRLQLPPGLPVIAAGGDGFLASLGSGCRTRERLAITIGTTAGVRRFQQHSEDPTGSGVFCYRFAANRFLVGCASNNGGNVLGWARKEFDSDSTIDAKTELEPPVFLPFVFGERAPFWDTSRSARWLEISDRHTPGDLCRGVVEGVVFTVAMYCRIVGEVSGRPTVGVLSGNGFRLPLLDRALAAIVPFPLKVPPQAGTATLRGAAAVAFETLGVDVEDAIDNVLDQSASVVALDDSLLVERFKRFARYYRASIPDL